MDPVVLEMVKVLGFPTAVAVTLLWSLLADRARILALLKDHSDTNKEQVRIQATTAEILRQMQETLKGVTETVMFCGQREAAEKRSR